MVPIQPFEEIRVCEGIAERTGVQFDRNDVRRSRACCSSLTELLRKGRAGGDGYFYLAPNTWPPNTDHIELQKKWVVMSSQPPGGLPL